MPLAKLIKNPETWKKIKGGDRVLAIAYDGGDTFDPEMAMYFLDGLVSERISKVTATSPGSSRKFSFNLYDFRESPFEEKAKQWADLLPLRPNGEPRLKSGELKNYVDHAKNVAQNYADSEVGWWRGRAALPDGSDLEYLEISGARPEDLNTAESLASILVSAARLARGRSDSLETFIVMNGTDFGRQKTILKKLGISFEHHVRMLAETKNEVLVIPESEIRSFAEKNPAWSEKIAVEKFPTIRQRSLVSPLNF
jgi:hypothetical protein